MVDRRDFLTYCAAGLASAAVPAWASSAAQPQWPSPPKVARIPTRIGKLGYSRIDEYAWLKSKDWHGVLRNPSALEPTIKAALEAENAYTAAMLAPSQALQDALVVRMRELDGAQGTPLELSDGAYVYYQRQAAGSDYPIYARRLALGGREEVLLDVGQEAAGKTYYAVNFAGPQRSQGGKVFGWAADQTGSGIYQITVKEISTGKVIAQDITNAHGQFAFSPDARWLYWVGRSDKGRPSKVFRRDLAKGGDTLIYEESDPAFFIGMQTLASGAYVTIKMFNGAMSEVRLISMKTPTQTPVVVEPRTPGLTYDVDDWNGQLLIRTDADGAVDFKLMTASYDNPGRAAWKEIIPHEAGRYLVAVHPFAGHLVREEWRDALPRLVIMSTDGSEQEIDFKEPAYSISVPGAQAFSSAVLAFEFESPNTPEQARHVELSTGKLQPLRGGSKSLAFDPSDYEVRRLVASTEDGVNIPITVVMRKGQALDGSSPLFLYGYGSYGVSMPADFSSSAIALVDRGWIYAIAHVRGGAERGSAWWRSVLKHGKKKTFNDFIDCAEYLISSRYTRAGRIVAHGLSAGGLLMGAVYTMRPDLWAGLIAQVPFVDALTTLEAYDEHPLGTTSFPIWGDPRVPEDHAYVASYSPYDHLEESAYPALLATGSVADDRVAYWEPVKFAVKARYLTTAGNPIMSKTSMASGHAGDSGAKAAFDQKAFFSAFAIWAADRKWGEVP